MNFDRGDLVYKLDNSTKVGQSKKLRPVWLVPYVVTEVLSPIPYWIEGSWKTHVVHHDRIKICRDRVIPMWMCWKGHEILDLDETIPQADTATKGNDLASTHIDTKVGVVTQTPVERIHSSDVNSAENQTVENESEVNDFHISYSVDLPFASVQEEDLPDMEKETEHLEEEEVQVPISTNTRTREKRRPAKYM